MWIDVLITNSVTGGQRKARVSMAVDLKDRVQQTVFPGQTKVLWVSEASLPLQRLSAEHLEHSSNSQMTCYALVRLSCFSLFHAASYSVKLEWVHTCSPGLLTGAGLGFVVQRTTLFILDMLQKPPECDLSPLTQVCTYTVLCQCVCLQTWQRNMIIFKKEGGTDLLTVQRVWCHHTFMSTSPGNNHYELITFMKKAPIIISFFCASLHLFA